MKKYISLIVAFCLLCVMALPCAAQGTVIQPKIQKEGTALDVSFPLPKDCGIATLLSTLHYDQDKLAIVSVDYANADAFTYEDGVLGEIKFSAIWAEKQTEETALCTMHFVIKDLSGTVDFTFTGTEVTDENDKAMAVSFQNITYDLEKGTVALKAASSEKDTTKEAEEAPTKADGTVDDSKADIPKTSGVPIAVGVTVGCVAGVLSVILVQRKKAKKES